MRTVLETDIGGDTVSFVQDDDGLCTVEIKPDEPDLADLVVTLAERVSYDTAQIAYVTWVLGYLEADRA